LNRIAGMNSVTRLKRVLPPVPPKKPVIYIGPNKSLAKILQPFNEGSEMSLLCEVIGGSPPPKVTWYLKGQVQNNTYTQEHEDIMINRLNILVTRDFLRARLICKANNTQLMTPLTSEIILDVNRECKLKCVNCIEIPRGIAIAARDRIHLLVVRRASSLKKRPWEIHRSYV